MERSSIALRKHGGSTPTSRPLYFFFLLPGRFFSRYWQDWLHNLLPLFTQKSSSQGGNPTTWLQIANTALCTHTPFPALLSSVVQAPWPCLRPRLRPIVHLSQLQLKGSFMRTEILTLVPLENPQSPGQSLAHSRQSINTCLLMTD